MLCYGDALLLVGGGVVWRRGVAAENKGADTDRNGPSDGCVAFAHDRQPRSSCQDTGTTHLLLRGTGK